MQRLDAAKSRIESLNPLVKVETMSEVSVLEDERFESIVKTVDLVCVTDLDERSMVSASRRSVVLSIHDILFIVIQIRVNETCRKHGKLFYAGGTYGLVGYIFCDLLSHEYLTP